MTPTTVLMASTSYPTDASDWRGVFIRSMTCALARRNDIALKVWCPRGQFPAGIEYAANPADEAWMSELSRSGGIAHALRSGRLAALLRPIQLLVRLRALYRRQASVDLVHANWLQVALPLPANRKPLLVTVLGTDYQLLRLPGMKRLLRRVLASRRAIICPNADWMVPGLEAAFGDIAKVDCVPFGIDSAYFGLERQPLSPAHWLCVSRVTRPKIGDLFRWGERHFRGQPRQLHLFGPMQEPVDIPDWVHYHGPVSQSDLLERWFPSATGLISLSRHPEGLPQVMLEAMAASLPIIASALPAHCSLIQPSGAGRICGSEHELGLALAELGHPEEGARIGASGRQFAMARFGTWDTCAERYMAHYRSLLAS